MAYARIIFDPDTAAVTKEQAEQVIAAARAHIQAAGISQGDLARRSGVAASTLSMFLQGLYAGDWRGLAADLDSYFEQVEVMSDADRLNTFVETRVAREILGAASAVMEEQHGGISLIHGDSGIGKTEAIRELRRRTSGCVFISAATAKARIKGLLMDIGEKMHRHVGERSTADTFNRTAEALRGYKLLIVDEIHKYCGRDDCFHTLRDLYDATETPQLWSGTTDLIRYFDRKIVQGFEPLAQIRRRILVARDLNDLATAEGGMFSTAEVRKLLAGGRHKLDAAAARYLTQLGNLRGEGGLGLVKNLYSMACKLATASHAPLITADMLRKAHGYQVSQRTRAAVEKKLAGEAAAEGTATAADGRAMKCELRRATA